MSLSLRDAVRTHDLPAVEAALTAHPAVDELVAQLHVAAYRGDLPITQALWQAHPSPDDALRAEVVSYAARSGSEAVVEAFALPAMRQGILQTALDHRQDALFVATLRQGPTPEELQRWLPNVLQTHRWPLIEALVPILAEQPVAWKEAVWLTALKDGRATLLQDLMTHHGLTWSDPDHRGLFAALATNDRPMRTLLQAHLTTTDLEAIVAGWADQMNMTDGLDDYDREAFLGYAQAPIVYPEDEAQLREVNGWLMERRAQDRARTLTAQPAPALRRPRPRG